MKREEKELLKDLCARLPYGVKVSIWEYLNAEILVGLDINKQTFNLEYSIDQPIFSRHNELIIKPYLRSLSSMTKDEIKEFDEFCVIDEYAWRGGNIQGFINQAEIIQNGIDWLNAHHFDYRGLIKKGLALEAPEGMYEI